MCARQSSTTLCASTNATSQAPSPMHRLEREQVCGEARPQSGEHGRTAQAPLQHPFKHKQDSWRRHVAVAAQDFALVAQRSFLQLECDFDRIKHLRAAWMADELGCMQLRSLYESSHRRGQQPGSNIPKVHQCPLWVKSRHLQCTNPCLLCANSGLGVGTNTRWCW